MRSLGSLLTAHGITAEFNNSDRARAQRFRKADCIATASAKVPVDGGGVVNESRVHREHTVANPQNQVDRWFESTALDSPSFFVFAKSKSRSSHDQVFREPDLLQAFAQCRA